jgi:hypothetical protein
MEVIKVNEMLAIMNTRDEAGELIPATIRAITCNVKKGTGGKRITYKDVILVGGSTSNSTVRNPNHFQNFTRNIKSIRNSEIREFHPLLAEEFNGMRVVL